jgi:hypothetical protein
MNLPNWQFVATLACIGIAALVVLRRVLRLIGSSQTDGCGTGSCSTCPTAHFNSASSPAEGFVPLESLVTSGQFLTTSGRSKAASEKSA